MDVYLLGILVTITIFALVAVSLDLLIGYTGLFTIAQAAMFGAGAYASGLVSLKLGWGFWGGAAVAIAVGALIASVVAIPSLRVSGDYLVLASFGVQVVKGVDSARVKLLYDIYHMQIMEGDLIRTIRQNIGSIAHFHTGGVPDRHELDDTQEVNWRAVSKAIVDLGFTGYVAHEFQPTRDPLTSQREAVALCDV